MVAAVDNIVVADAHIVVVIPANSVRRDRVALWV